MTTIKDVAKRARVSITSASYAINGTGTISAETRKRVLKVAEELDYHPNAFARNLKKRKTLTIGVFINGFGGSFYDEILDGIHDAVLKTDYELIVCPGSRTAPRLLTQRQVDGAIIFASEIKTDLIVKVAAKKFPIVLLDRYLESEYLFPLLLDNQQGTREAFQHLYEQGARRIAFISGMMDSIDNRERMKAFLSEGDKNNLNVQRYDGNFTEKSGYEIACDMIQRKDIPEAVFCANDQMAIGFLRAMKDHRMTAPEDIAVVGFDDIQIAKHMRPSLSSIGASRFSWGALAVTQLMDFLENEKPFPKPYRIRTKLIPRESSTKFPVQPENLS
ncbi:MAG TPA: LacI family DNA-binding transcriptional regulator [Anaerolineales bacterium]|nr:LacI family DNA-binding transcriptional regulator [Anaerolineales bacterium]